MFNYALKLIPFWWRVLCSSTRSKSQSFYLFSFSCHSKCPEIKDTAALSTNLFHCPMQGPQAFASTIPPKSLKVSAWQITNHINRTSFKQINKLVMQKIYKICFCGRDIWIQVFACNVQGNCYLRLLNCAVPGNINFLYYRDGWKSQNSQLLNRG